MAVKKQAALRRIDRKMNVIPRLILLLCMLCIIPVDATEITTPPISINTTQNSEVTFYCSATRALLMSFWVNGVSASDVNVTDKGFKQYVDARDTAAVEGQLTVKAYAFNNQSRITCSVVGPGVSPPVYSPQALLLIQGNDVYMYAVYHFTTGT